MSPEIPGGRDHPSQAPRNNGSHGNDRPENGYPPKGYAENKQQLSMQEAITIATENPDGQLEKELALADILPWVKECLPDCQPHKLAAECCFSMQVEARCLVPDFDGVLYSQEWKEALWDKFYTAAPRRQRRCVERYNIVKRA